MWLVGDEARALVDREVPGPGDYRGELMTLDRALSSPRRLLAGGVALLMGCAASVVVALAVLTIIDGRMDLVSWLLTALAVMVLLASVAVLVGLARSGSRLVDAWLRWFAAHQGRVGRRGQWGRFFTLASWIRGAATGAVLLTGLMAAGLVFAGLSPANPAGFDRQGRLFAVVVGLIWGALLLTTTVVFARGDFRTTMAIGRRVRDEYERR